MSEETPNKPMPQPKPMALKMKPVTGKPILKQGLKSTEGLKPQLKMGLKPALKAKPTSPAEARPKPPTPQENTVATESQGASSPSSGTEPAAKTYTLAELQEWPADLDQARLETYLSPQDFKKLFNMTLPDFQKQPQWKQNNQKNKLKLIPSKPLVPKIATSQDIEFESAPQSPSLSVLPISHSRGPSYSEPAQTPPSPTTPTSTTLAPDVYDPTPAHQDTQVTTSSHIRVPSETNISTTDPYASINVSIDQSYESSHETATPRTEPVTPRNETPASLNSSLVFDPSPRGSLLTSTDIDPTPFGRTTPDTSFVNQSEESPLNLSQSRESGVFGQIAPTALHQKKPADQTLVYDNVEEMIQMLDKANEEPKEQEEEEKRDPIKELEGLLVDPQYGVIKAVMAETQVTEADKVSKYLITVFEHHKQSIELIKVALKCEVDAAVETNALLRANSFASKLMKEFCNVVGKPYLREVFNDHISPLCINPTEGGASFEIDTTKIKEGEDLEKNRNKLKEACQSILETIMDKGDSLPIEVRQMCYWTRVLVAEKFENFTQASVGGFIFLRYLCPAIVAPTAAAIVSNAPSPEAQRGLTLIAKVLQNISNRVEFGKKEEFMEFMNEFVQNYFDAVGEYFEKVSELGPQWENMPPAPRETSYTGPQLVQKKTSELHLLVKHLTTLKPMMEKYAQEPWYPMLQEVLKLYAEQQSSSSQTPADPLEKEMIMEFVNEERLMIGATMPRLVERLTPADNPTTEYLFSFFFGYRSIASPRVLFTMLRKRFHEPLSRAWVISVQPSAASAIQLNVVMAIEFWVDKFFHHFDADPPLVTEIIEFLEKEAMGKGSISERLVNGVIQKIELRKKVGDVAESRTPRSNPPKTLLIQYVEKSSKSTKPKPTQEWTFLDFHPIELARQMTLCEFEMFQKLPLKEFFDTAWTKKDKQQRAPNIRRMIARFNQVSAWVANEILHHAEPKKRGKVIDRFLLIARHCEIGFNNFNTSMEIFSALQSGPINRLKQSWGFVSEQGLDYMERLKENLENNCKSIREALEIAEPPSLPYLGMCLSDLVFIQDGNPKLHKNGYINFHKWRLQSGPPSLVTKCQKTPYNFSPVAFIREYIERPPLVTNEDTLYDLSLKLEAREGEESSSSLTKSFFRGKEKDQETPLWEFVYPDEYLFSSPDTLETIKPSNSNIENACPLDGATVTKLFEKITSNKFVFFEGQEDPRSKGICTTCSKPIKGTKVVCMNCPKFSSCTTCHNKNSHAHNAAHLLLHATTHRMPDSKLISGLPVTTDITVSDSEADMHSASCFQCGVDIKGTMFRCAMCNNYRLCAECYPLEQYSHDRSHLWVEVRKRQLPDTKFLQLPNLGVDIDRHLTDMFLLTYRIWWSPQELLDKLAMRFQLPEIKNVLDIKLLKQLQDELRVMQFRVFGFIHRWAVFFWDQDFQNNLQLQINLGNFLQEMQKQLPETYTHVFTWFNEQIKILQSASDTTKKRLSMGPATQKLPPPSKPLPLKPPTKPLPSHPPPSAPPPKTTPSTKTPPRSPYVPPQREAQPFSEEVEKANKTLLYLQPRDLAEQLLAYWSSVMYKTHSSHWATDNASVHRLMDLTHGMTGWIFQCVSSSSEPTRIGRASFFLELAERSRELCDFNTARCVIEVLCHTSFAAPNLVQQLPQKLQLVFKNLVQLFAGSAADYLKNSAQATIQGGIPDCRRIFDAWVACPISGTQMIAWTPFYYASLLTINAHHMYTIPIFIPQQQPVQAAIIAVISKSPFVRSGFKSLDTVLPKKKSTTLGGLTHLGPSKQKEEESPKKTERKTGGLLGMLSGNKGTKSK